MYNYKIHILNRGVWKLKLSKNNNGILLTIKSPQLDIGKTCNLFNLSSVILFGSREGVRISFWTSHSLWCLRHLSHSNRWMLPVGIAKQMHLCFQCSCFKLASWLLHICHERGNTILPLLQLLVWKLQKQIVDSYLMGLVSCTSVHVQCKCLTQNRWDILHK